MTEDAESTELRALAEDQGWLRYVEMGRELAERARDEEMRRDRAWEERAAAIDARLDTAERLALRGVLSLGAVIGAVVVAVEVVRLFG